MNEHLCAAPPGPPAPPAPPRNTPPKAHYAAARLLERRGDFDGAIDQYRRAIALSADYIDAWWRVVNWIKVGEIYVRTQQAVSKAGAVVR